VAVKHGQFFGSPLAVLVTPLPRLTGLSAPFTHLPRSPSSPSPPPNARAWSSHASRRLSLPWLTVIGHVTAGGKEPGAGGQVAPDIVRTRQEYLGLGGQVRSENVMMMMMMMMMMMLPMYQGHGQRHAFAGKSSW
jgi:hypothetical protein